MVTKTLFILFLLHMCGQSNARNNLVLVMLQYRADGLQDVHRRQHVGVLFEPHVQLFDVLPMMQQSIPQSLKHIRLHN